MTSGGRVWRISRRPDAAADVPEREDWALTPFVPKGGGSMHARDLARIDRRHSVCTAGEPLAIRLVIGS
ncbi:MAG TPA: hypothetical protein VI076_03485 [Actinopolymorphaceae bacterium]